MSALSSAQAGELALRIVRAVWLELGGRSGFDHLIDGLRDDPEVNDELEAALVERVRTELLRG